MIGSELVFNYVKLMYYKCYKTNLNRCGSYMNSPDWIKINEAKINPINKKDNKYFQYTVTVTLNYEEIKENPQRITKVKPKHHGGFYCLNCFHSFTTENKLQAHKRVCENKDSSNIIMPSDHAKILQFNKYQKSDKALFIIYEDPGVYNKKN